MYYALDREMVGRYLKYQVYVIRRPVLQIKKPQKKKLFMLTAPFNDSQKTQALV